MKPIQIIAEASIPYLRGVIEQLGQVTYLPSHEFTAQNISNADWLIIRSITKCHKSLLQGSQVKLITTATIGFDHIDTKYCESEGIKWANAPGCNAEAVGQYFGASMALLHQETGFQTKGKTLGIVGVGHVGKVVERYGRALGMKVLLNDPPRERSEGPAGFTSLQKIAEDADVITFHVPLTYDGPNATYHLCNREFISQLKKKPIIINACRGAVTDTQALIRGLENNIIHKVIIDCWENEPHISDELLQKTWLGTPHIAGFSKQGKANGARKCVEEGIRFFRLNSDAAKSMYPTPPENSLLHLSPSTAPLMEALIKTLNLREVDTLLRSGLYDFEALRRSYNLPHEPSSYTLLQNQIGLDDTSAQLIGFKVV